VSIEDEIKEIKVTIVANIIILVILISLLSFVIPPTPEYTPKNQVKFSESITIISTIKTLGWTALLLTNPACAVTTLMSYKVSEKIKL